MAIETELYIVYPEDFTEKFQVSPAIITTDLEIIRNSLEELQKAASHTRWLFKVLKITEAEQMYSITPEAMDEEVDEDLMTQIGNYLDSVNKENPF